MSGAETAGVGGENFTVRFWGVRGSIACPGRETLRYGGDTSCIELYCGRRRLIFDAGTGIRRLSRDWLGGRELDPPPPAGKDSERFDADLFFSHTHYDHIGGLPFFRPLYRPDSRVRLWAGHLEPGIHLRDVVGRLMKPPLFPLSPDMFGPGVSYHDFTAGETLQPGDGAVVRTAPLNHPDGCTAYRVDYGGRALCYATDTEHVSGRPDQTLLDLIRGADALIYDCTYQDEEFSNHQGWGHSTWQEGVRLCEAAGVERLILFHHEPNRSDSELDAVAARARQRFPGAIVAAEDMVLTVGAGVKEPSKDAAPDDQEV